MKLKFLFKTKGLVVVHPEWIPGRPLRSAQQQAAKPGWKTWASPCVCPRVFDCCVMHSEISVEKLFGGSLGVRVWAFADWRDCQTPADCEMEYVVCVCVCVSVCFSLFLFAPGQEFIVLDTNTQPAERQADRQDLSLCLSNTVAAIL